MIDELLFSLNCLFSYKYELVVYVIYYLLDILSEKYKATKYDIRKLKKLKNYTFVDKNKIYLFIDSLIRQIIGQFGKHDDKTNSNNDIHYNYNIEGDFDTNMKKLLRDYDNDFLHDLFLQRPVNQNKYNNKQNNNDWVILVPSLIFTYKTNSCVNKSYGLTDKNKETNILESKHHNLKEFVENHINGIVNGAISDIRNHLNDEYDMVDQILTIDDINEKKTALCKNIRKINDESNNSIKMFLKNIANYTHNYLYIDILNNQTYDEYYVLFINHIFQALKP